MTTYIFLVLILLIGRLMDILSTYYVESEIKNNKYEINPLARYYGWKLMIILSLIISFILPYVSIYGTLALIGVSYYVTLNNLFCGCICRRYDKENYISFIDNSIRKLISNNKISIYEYVLYNIAPYVYVTCIVSLGLLLIHIDWIYYTLLGILFLEVYTIISLIITYIKTYREYRKII